MSVVDEPVTGTAPVPPLRRNRDFVLLWTGAGISLLGGRVSAVAYPLLMVWTNGSTVGAGMVAFAALLPTLLIQLPAGVLVDRMDRRKIMIVCDLAGFAAMGSVVIALFAGHLWLPHLMAAAFVEGGAAIMYRLAERAAVRNVVHPSHLSAAMSQNEARGRAAGLIGQPVGSSLFALVAWAPFLTTAIGHVVALVNLLLIRSPFQQPRASTDRDLRRELAEGFAWLWRQRFLRAAVGLVAGSNLLFQVIGLALIVIVHQHGGSPAAIGIVGAVSGIGGMLGALSGSWWMHRLTPATLVASAFGVWAVLMTSVALTANLFVLGALFAGMTFAGAVLNVSAGVYQVRITPDELQGRVSSTAILFASGANSLGALCAGYLLSRYGTTPVVLGAGAAMTAMALVAVVSPAIRSANRLLPANDADTEEI